MCAAGTHSTTPENGCTDCPPGSYSDSDGSQSCTECEAGKSSSDIASVSCTDCEAGKFSKETRSLECSNCPSGRYGNSGGAVNPMSDCIQCQPGKYSTSGGGTECSLCDVGSVAEKTGSAKCEMCRTGMIPNEVNTTCLQCGVGKYASRGDIECTACSANEVAPKPGSGACELCEDEEFVGGPIMQDCLGIEVDTVDIPAFIDTEGGAEITVRGTGMDISIEFVVTVGGAVCNSKRRTTESITCSVPEGVGENNAITVTHPDRMMVSGTSQTTLTYAPPIVSTVQSAGCNDNSQGRVSGCPTLGGVTITVSGNNFGPSGSMVQIGGRMCDSVVHSSTNPHGELTCLLPAGVGAMLTVSVTAGAQMGESNLLTYLKPTVHSIEGCPLGENGVMACPRISDGTDIILTVTGENFGPRQSFVLIGGVLADQASMKTSDDPQNVSKIVLPNGSGLWQKVSVLQNGGIIGPGVSLLDYEMCDVSTYNKYNRTAGHMTCVTCEEGKVGMSRPRIVYSLSLVPNPNRFCDSLRSAPPPAYRSTRTRRSR